MNTGLLYPKGRTLSEAAAAGDSYKCVARDGTAIHFPGLGGIEETLCHLRALQSWHHRKGETVLLYRVLPGSVTGCMILEDPAREVTL